MVKMLKDCEVGDVVRLYCIGWGSFDNQLSRVIDKGFFITVKSEDGATSRMVDTAECQVMD